MAGVNPIGIFGSLQGLLDQDPAIRRAGTDTAPVELNSRAEVQRGEAAAAALTHTPVTRDFSFYLVHAHALFSLVIGGGVVHANRGGETSSGDGSNRGQSSGRLSELFSAEGVSPAFTASIGLVGTLRDPLSGAELAYDYSVFQGFENRANDGRGLVIPQASDASLQAFYVRGLVA